MKTRNTWILMAALGLPAAWAQTAPTSPSHVLNREEAVSAAAIDIAQHVYVGRMPCELGAAVNLSRDRAAPGYFNVNGKGFRYRMKPVATSTGAIRLEDTKAGAVWLQLANKSMLMDQKNGRRLADECAHPDQMAYAKEMVINPPPSLIDTTGMGR